ncbi:MAG: nucleotidyltransferase family protein [Bacteroidales bacterium]|nr:nucleotidyltransferase family protein [Bacteroidales bacterium]
MQAFLLAAGLGTRLRPLTLTRPKALVEVRGKTLLETNIERLAEAGAKRIVVNVHHFADMMKGYIASREWPTEVLVSDEAEKLLDTGGGLKHAQSLFMASEPILVYNVDVLSRFSLEGMLLRHKEERAMATLAVSRRETQRYLLFCNNRLVGWCNKKSGEKLCIGEVCLHPYELAFSGIAIVEPRLLELLPPSSEPYPIIPEYLRLAKCEHIEAYVHSASDWLDVGKPETLRLIK